VTEAREGPGRQAKGGAIVCALSCLHLGYLPVAFDERCHQNVLKKAMIPRTAPTGTVSNARPIPMSVP